MTPHTPAVNAAGELLPEQPKSVYSASGDLTGAYAGAAQSTLYIIASLKHTNKHHEHITFWGPDYRGYVIAITDDRVGRYSAEYIAKDGGHLNDGECCIAVPVDLVKSLLSPMPFYAQGGKLRQFYDTPGPVVDNTRANWNRLIAASMTEHRRYKPKPEVFKGSRRSFSIDVEFARAIRAVEAPSSANQQMDPESSAALATQGVQL